MTKEIQIIEENYLHFLDELKKEVRTSQVKAHLSVNKEMLILYWKIGKGIINKQGQEGWGTKITKRLSEDLVKSFPNMKGFSYTNVRYMQRFAEHYPDLLICQQVVGKLGNGLLEQEISTSKGDKPICQAPLGKLEQQIFYSDYSNSILGITWYHNIALLDKVKEQAQRFWYAKKTIENGWSRNVLVHQITTNLYDRQAKADSKINNFKEVLTLEQSEALQETIKGEYNLTFFDEVTKGAIAERQLENALVENIIKFLTELGKGFAFVGRQYHLEVDQQDFYIDLLFYHIKLKSYIVIELKTGKFKPEYAGKMGFYLACVDDYLKDKNDNDSIGIILCQDESTQIKEKSLQCMLKPIGVSNYKLAERKDLPEELKPLEDLKAIIKQK